MRDRKRLCKLNLIASEKSSNWGGRERREKSRLMSRFSGLGRRRRRRRKSNRTELAASSFSKPAGLIFVSVVDEANKTTKTTRSEKDREIATTTNEGTRKRESQDNNNNRKRRRKRRQKVMMISSKEEEEERKVRKFSSKKMKKRFFPHLHVSLIPILGSIFLMSQQIYPSEGAVVRPTIFSGLSPGDMMSSTSQVSTGQPPAALLQQQSNGITGTAGSSSSSSLSSMFQVVDGQHQLAHTKINPYKSRFCLNSVHPLGLQSMDVDDLSLSASSHSNEQVRPQLARLNLELAGGAWCPGKPISATTFGKEWIQVKLNRSHVISAIETQGRFGMGAGKEFVPSYTVEYSRNSGKTWHKWKDFRGSSLLRANEDVNSPVRNELSPPIVGANLVRIFPYSQHLRTVCLRFELYGCSYDEGAPIAYSTSEGVVEPRWGHLIDYTYDGLRHSGRLNGGLGQLVDGVFGPDNFSHNMGFEWVGWKSMNGDVEIEFTFSSLRNFSQAQFHSNNLFSNGVEVFQAIDVYYGIEQTLAFESLKDNFREERRRDAILRTQAEPFESANGGAESTTTNSNTNGGTLWSTDVLSIEYEPDKRNEAARPVTVHLKQRLANKLKFVLKFASKWILLSEVEFISSRVELLGLNSFLSSASEREQSLALLSALTHPNSQPSTYDQYLAIVREHQLRRAAASAYLESFAPSKPTVIDITIQDSENTPLLAATSLNVPDPNLALSSSSTGSYPQLDEPALGQQYTQPRRIVGPPIPPHSLWSLGPGTGGPITGNIGLDNSQVPASNPMLSQLGPPLFGQTLFGPASNSILVGRPTNTNFEQPVSGLDQSGGISLGPVSAISLALVALLALIIILILISGHRFGYNRRRPTLAGIGVSSISKRSTTSSTGSKPITGFNAFLNQILHPTSGARNHHHSPQTGSLLSQHQEPQHLYNAIFATNDRHQHTHKPVHPILPGQHQESQHLYNTIFAPNDRHQHTLKPIHPMLPGQHQEPQHLYNAIFATNDRHQHTHKPVHPILPGQQQQQHQPYYRIIL